MYYTVIVKRICFRLIGCMLFLALAACGSGLTLPATPKAEATPNSLTSSLKRVAPASLAQICNCIPRFEHISIEQGLSQSSIYMIFQDSRGFIWFGTEDGLNRYDGYAFKTYKPDPDNPRSLSDRWINSIVEDNAGYLWIGTRLGGINRYDPSTEQFTHYQHEESNPLSLNDNMVNVLYLDKSNNLWVGTPSGLDLLVRESNTFKHYAYNPAQQEGITGKNITAIFEDSRGRLWLGTSAGGLNLFNPHNNTFKSYQSESQNDSTLSDDHITALAEDRNSALWVGTANGLNKFNPDTETFQRFIHSDQDSQSLTSNMIYALLMDSTGNLWVGTTKGLDRLSLTGKRFTHYHNEPTYSQSLSSDRVLSIYEDRGGVLWFGTLGGGINKYDRQHDQYAYYRSDPNNPNSLSGNLIISIYADAEGYTWIGTIGNGLNRFTKSTNQVIRYQNNPKNPNSIISNTIFSIHEDKDGMLWIGTDNGLDRFDRKSFSFTHYQRDTEKPDSLSANRVYVTYVDSHNDVWAGTAGGLDRYDRSTNSFIHYTYQVDDAASLSGPYVSSITEDQDGNLWVGTFDDGLNKFNRATQTFIRFRHDPLNKGSISNDSILSILRDSRDRLWIGTAGGGLNQYHPETNSFTYLLEKDGLPNGVVYGILEDGGGKLWMSTNYGLSRFDPETHTFRNFDAGDGLQSNEFNSGAYARGRDGEFYFGGINGLTLFQPLSIRNNQYPPQITLTSLSQGDQPVQTKSSVETTREITLVWPQNTFEFEFAALSYNQPAKNQYAYMLEDFDTSWHFIGTKRDGRYTNLPGGRYNLLLKAANSDGVWTETPTHISVTVVPPFWQNNWFRIFAILGAVVVIAGGMRLRTKTIQDRNRHLEQLVQERTQALENRNMEMEALYKADERILRNVSLNQVFQTLVDVAVDMLHADCSVVFVWDDKQTKVIPRVSHGYSPETLKVMEFPKGEGNVGHVLATGKPVIAKELDPETMRPDVRQAIMAEGIRSFVHLPIVVDHKVVAVFNVAFTRPNFIGEDAVRVFSALVNRASISIANMELFEQTKDLAVMEERNRLARDLHDSAKQKAFAALAQLGTARGILNGNGSSVSIHLNEAENLVADVIQELTFLVQEIYPSALQEKGLANILREHIFEWENRNDTKVQFSVQNERRLPLEIEQALYRVTQEAMANVARHSQARRVDLALMFNPDSIQLSLSDDGQGFDMNTKLHGMGLRSIRERISSVHGTVLIQSAPGQGTRLIVQVPIKS